jgi:hypothetical protein
VEFTKGARRPSGRADKKGIYCLVRYCKATGDLIEPGVGKGALVIKSSHSGIKNLIFPTTTSCCLSGCLSGFNKRMLRGYIFFHEASRP